MEFEAALHEVGHGIFYILNETEFEHISIIPDESSAGRVHGNPRYDLANYFQMYFGRTPSGYINFIHEDLNILLEINLAGILAEYYFLDQKEEISLEQLLDNKFGDLFREYNSLSDLEEIFLKFPESSSFREASAIGFNVEAVKELASRLFCSEEYILSFAILMLFYKNNWEKMWEQLVQTSQKILTILEEKEKTVKYLADILMEKKQFTYEEFILHYKRFCN